MTGTFAWMDYDQHKSNKFGLPEMQYSVTLNETFDKVQNWAADNPLVTKELNITNTGVDDGSFGELYVRIQVKEYFEITPVRYTYTENRYLAAAADETSGGPAYVAEINSFLEAGGITDANWHAQYGENSYEDFITFKSEEAAGKFLQLAVSDPIWQQKLGDDNTPEYIAAVNDILCSPVTGLPVLDANENEQLVSRWYIRTAQDTSGGQLCKNIPVAKEPLTNKTETLTERQGIKPPNASVSAAQNHNDGTLNCLEWHTQNGMWKDHVCSTEKPQAQHDNKECDYLVHLWAEEESGICDLKSHNHIKWFLGSEVITLKQWKEDYNSAPVQKWILDTSCPFGWAYWGAALAPGETTANLLETVELTTQPGGQAFYTLHAEMEAVDHQRLANWGTEIAKYIGARPGIALQPEFEVMAPGASKEFELVVTDIHTPDITWTIEGGTDPATDITQNGILTIGAGEQPGTIIKVTATESTSVISATAVVTVGETP